MNILHRALVAVQAAAGLQDAQLATFSLLEGRKEGNLLTSILIYLLTLILIYLLYICSSHSGLIRCPA